MTGSEEGFCDATRDGAGVGKYWAEGTGMGWDDMGGGKVGGE